MIFTFTKTIASEFSDTIVSQETFLGLGVSNIGASKGLLIPSLATAPYVRVESMEDRRLYVDKSSVTNLGFDILGADIGGVPPYDVSILIDTTLSLNQDPTAITSLGAIRRQLRNTYFNLPRSGRLDNLWSTEGLEVMSDTNLLDIANLALREVNLQVMEDSETTQVTLASGSDNVTLPSDVGIIKEVILNLDSTTKQSLRSAVSLNSFFDRTLPGAPDQYLAWKQTQTGDPVSSRVLIFDVVSDGDYTLDIYFWKLPDDMVGDNEVPELFSGYHELILDKARAKIAKTIGDTRRMQEFTATYHEILQMALGSLRAHRRPTKTLYRDMNITQEGIFRKPKDHECF
jgi:hypothetical protein